MMVNRRKQRRGSQVVQKEIARRRSKIIERTPPTYTRDSSQRKNLRIVYGILIAIVIIIIVYILIFSGLLRVQRVVIVGTENVSDKRIEEIIYSEGEGAWWGILPKNNVILFNSQKAETYLSEQIAQIREVEITKQLPNILKVHVEERDPVIIWEADGKKYYLDVDGVVSKDIGGNPELPLPVIRDLSNKQVAAREKIVSDTFVDFVVDLMESFHKETGLEISELLTPSPLSREVHIKTNEDWLVYFTSARTLDSQFQKLLLILNKEISKEQRQNLEYIDLRIKDKIYYK